MFSTHRCQSSNPAHDNLFCKCLIMALFPFALVFIYCLIRGINPFTLYIPNSTNNDSLFYYKLVESIVENGKPSGYFGFNESHAPIGGFCSWNPLILSAWIIWGFLFGISSTSLLLCNIILFSFSLAMFTFLARPDWKHLIAVIFLLSIFPSLPIHLLTMLPEINIASCLIIILGLSIRQATSKKPFLCLVIMAILSSILTIIRPYFALYLLLAFYYIAKRKRPKEILFILIDLLLTMGVYFFSSHYLTSPYFVPLFYTDLINYLIHFQFSSALVFIKDVGLPTGYKIWDLIKQGFTTGYTLGTHYIIVALSVCFIFFSCFSRKKKSELPNKIAYILTGGGMFIAIALILLNPGEGGRHMFSFAICGIILCACNMDSFVQKAGNILIGVVLIILLLHGSFIPTYYDVVQEDQALEGNIAYWEKTFSNKGVQSSENLCFDNTLIWVLSDNSSDVVITDYRELFAVPSGIGINCCLYSYVNDNFNQLNGRYIATPSDGLLSQKCIEAGYTEIGHTDKVTIYQRY